jgi:nitroreductase
MEHGLPDDETIRAAITLAIRAPSVHNSQPWRWRIGDATVHLYADPSVHLRRADPDRRDLILSCGTVLHHFRLALAALGWGAKVHRFPNPADIDHVASIELQRRTSTEQDIALAAAISRRRTDRRNFSSWPVPSGHIALMAARAAHEGVVLHRIEASTYLERAIEQAAAKHATDADYQAELKMWSGRRASLDGVPATSITATDRSNRLHARMFADPRLEQPAGTSPQKDASELLVLATPSDDAISRLRAGEATSAVLLTATTLGLASCSLTEPLEIPETRAIVRSQALGDSGFPQMVLRIGWASINADPLPATPRHTANEIIDPLDPESGPTGIRK